MRRSRDLVLLVPLALLVAGPVRARAQEPVAPPVTPGAAQEYQDRYDKERLDREREEQEKQREQWEPSRAALARRGEGIQVQSIPETDLTVVLHQLEAKDGELLVRLRFYNDGAEPARLVLDPTADYESFYVRVGREKLHLLRDEDGDLDAKKPLDEELKPGKMESWWAKFPAPPAGTESFDLSIPPAATFHEVEIPD